ncbi:MAG: M6 family metalloprotease domain-containing protein [bacterium]
MPRRFSFCLTVMCIASFVTSVGLAVMPPRPGSDAQLPIVAEELLAERFGQVSRPARRSPLEMTSHGLTDSEVRAATQVSGSRALPVLLGDCGDRVGTNASATLAAELFGSWPTGSMTDYYTQVSYGQFSLTGSVYGWYRLAQNASYYEGGAGCNGLCGYPGSAGGFVRELVQLADLGGVDWGQYDSDGPDGVPNSGDDDGYVDTVVIIHSGPGGECGGNNYIWSHSFYLRGWGILAYTTQTNRAGGGKIKIDDYIIQPEISCYGGMIEIGVFCHEYGHALGLPDLYDTSQAGEGIGRWGLMAAGSWGGDGASPDQPVHMNAWSKVYLGWIEPTVVTYDDTYELSAVELAPTVLKVWSAGSPIGEYFLVENRQRTLNDSLLPRSGLNIWHIDESVITSGWYANEVNAGSPYGVAMEQADGLGHLEAGTNRGDGGDAWPGSSNKTSLTNGTYPDSRSNDGSGTPIVITQISPASMTMSAHISVGVEAPDSESPIITLISPNGGEDWPIGVNRSITWVASDNVGVVGVLLQVSYDGGAHFEPALASGLAASGAWSWNLPLAPSQSVVIRAVAADARGNEGLDSSDAVFTISDQFPPGVELFTPSGGETWSVHEIETVTWNAADNLGVCAIDLLLSVDDGATWPVTVATGLPNSGSYDWTIPSQISATCRLRVRAWDAAGLSNDDDSGTFTLANLTDVASGPESFRLGPCAPNPFNPMTVIHYHNPAVGPVRISIFNLLGRRVRTVINENRPAGPGQVRWDGMDEFGQGVASGIYYVQACAGTERSIMKVTLVR